MVSIGPVEIVGTAVAVHAAWWLLAACGFVGGVAVGVAGMGGGALMTPALVLLFNIDPRVAIASDIVNSLAMKPVGAAVHAVRGTVNWPLVRLLVAGGAPAAFLGAWLLNRLGDSAPARSDLRTLLGCALVVACASLLAKSALSARLRRSGRKVDNPAPWSLKPRPTFLVGIVGGVMIGMTSVGSGSLVLVLLMLLYPRLSTRAQVGTNLAQAVPLVVAATLGQVIFGHIDFAVTGSLVIGSVPGTYLGARVSSRAPDRLVRPVLVALLSASGLALLLTSYTSLAWALAVTAAVGLALWGAVDATLHTSEHWRAAGMDRTTWVALMGVGAPVGIGLVAAAPYVLYARPRLARHAPAAATPASAAPRHAEPEEASALAGAGVPASEGPRAGAP